ncbi:hypothetical protein HC028_09220 [Planosporangium flavigriseum]|uniref:Uncharacterized protein n=1 Tax=Planosporangium flavigriseum TaxID=373681 RepID=A0A8J3LUI9_9ACTN|nr:hypothetical protein [Planosporangium flavigriseum]NJC64681.1 hypothetical protein [Planosporangium flavigriseum]GIG74094.1 hypothetical protein Pfl04_24980 [Planosporangium flavigriseum]
MSFFEDSKGESSHATSPEQVAHLRRILDTHANEPSNGKCPICGIRACPDWRYAYDQLAAAGQLMAEPERWLRPTGREGRR